MTVMVQVAVAGDLAEAEEIQTILQSAGIQSELHAAVEQHPAAAVRRTAEGHGPGQSLERSTRSSP